MSRTQVITIAICVATIINQWSIAIYNKKAKKAPSGEVRKSVPRKMKPSQYIGFAADFAVLIASVYTVWMLISPDPLASASLIHVVLISFLAAVFMSTTRNITSRLSTP